MSAGEVVAIVGASGVGKSTLLHLLGALDRPTDGKVLVGGEALSEMDQEDTGRGSGIALSDSCFSSTTCSGTSRPWRTWPSPAGSVEHPEDESLDRARELLDAVGLSHRLDHMPTQLSGGEQQRVAVARALANDPLVLLADEPSGNLDASTSRDLHELLFRLREEQGTSMVLVTHNLDLARKSDRILELRDGFLHNGEPKDGSGAFSGSE